MNILTWYIEHHPLAEHARERSATKQDCLKQARHAVSLTGGESFNLTNESYSTLARSR